MEIRLHLDGRTGLVMHNPQLADPNNEYTRLIAEITGKRSKTDADHAEVARLEWFGGLYHDPEIGVYVPGVNVARCLTLAGGITRKGTAVRRAYQILTDRVPLVYEGSRDVAKLWAESEHRLSLPVGVNRGSRVMRMRPIFRQWSLVLEAGLIEDVLNLRTFEQIATQAGRSEGLLDARNLGYGRFEITVTQNGVH